jgi:hypothetical protein
MKHAIVAISGDDLLDRFFADIDEFWAWFDAGPGLNPKDVPSGSEYDEGYDIARTAFNNRIRATWWLVSWPEHIRNPRYDSNASYYPTTEADAREQADEVYGEF